MKSKPKGARSRNLHARGDVIYYERILRDGTRIKRSLETSDWEVAAARRHALEALKGFGKPALPTLEVPRFAEFAARYRAEDTWHLAPTTRGDRKHYLSEDGPLLSLFGSRPLDTISVPTLRDWWNVHVIGAGRSPATGRHYLDVLSKILGYAQDLGLIEANPVRDFRETLRRRSQTQRSRAESDPRRRIRPIEEPEQIARLVAEAEVEGPAPLVLVLLLLDAGLRLGEALGLTWGGIAWGQDEDDQTRALLIDRSRPRGGEEGYTKSGRARTVALSRRLRRALEELYRGRFQPGPEALVIRGETEGSIDPWNFRKREWRRICTRAGIGHRALKDLRDTYASHLLSTGVQLGYVSAQLGHSDVAVTARHYARWAGGDLYRQPLVLEAGEVPADFLARLAESPTTKVAAPSHHRPTTPDLEEPGPSGKSTELQAVCGDPGAIRTHDHQLRRSEAIPGNSRGYSAEVTRGRRGVVKLRIMSRRRMYDGARQTATRQPERRAPIEPATLSLGSYLRIQ